VAARTSLVKTFLIIFLVVMFSIAVAFPCHSTDREMSAPWDFNNPVPDKKEKTQEKDASFCASLLIQALRFYQDYISPVIGDRCVMEPSCSQYAIDAIRKHGCVIGSVMTSDRLIHEANEMDEAPVIETPEGQRYYDPVEANDFWWDKKPAGGSAQAESK